MIALDFDLVCTARLRIEDTEKEARLLEVMGMGSVTNMFGLQAQKNDGNGPVVLDA